MISPADDVFHQRTDDPFWNESAWFGFSIPERTLNGFVYFYHRPNMKYSSGGIAIWDPTGEEMYNCRYYDMGSIFPLDPTWEMYDFGFPNGLHVHCVEPWKTYRLSYGGNSSFYAGAGCELELTWESFLPPHQTGQPEGQQEWAPARQHYEQPGRMKGTVKVDGETFHVDCWSMRDHSWGVRKLVNNTRGYFPWGIASEKSGFQVYAMSDLPPERDPVTDTKLRIAAGWYLKGGRYGSLSNGTCTTTMRRDDGAPMRMEMCGIDSLGREFKAVGNAKAILSTVLYPWMFQWWAQFEWEFDGQICYGEEMDFFPLQHARKFIRSLRA
ncbi:DUF7065 domain-containing protein [Mycobacterium florentinum]|uniref:DUF7065 domain-containing protein n=1 Tax=Mycobacterium florentinum TaxID=292462 RepID=UPI00111C8481|nr:hypothetical protein [Mycobacterium florentinum]MCV7412452.1 hypothetical protein [Mycobacterium florentinum]